MISRRESFFPHSLINFFSFRPFQSRLQLGDPFAPFRVSVLRIDVVLGVFQPLVNAFQAVRFLTDAFDQVNLDVPPLQQSDGLAVTNVPKCIGALRLWMEFVFGYDITIRLHSRRLP